MKTTLIILGCLAVLTGILCLRLRIRAGYRAGGCRLVVCWGPVTVRLLPARRPKKQGREKKEKKAKRDRKKDEEERTDLGGSIAFFRELLDRLQPVLGKLKRKLRVDRLVFRFTAAAADPFDAAMRYGAAQAAAAVLLQTLESLFSIRSRDVSVNADFSVSEPSVAAELELSLALGTVLALAAEFLIQAILAKKTVSD